MVPLPPQEPDPTDVTSAVKHFRDYNCIVFAIYTSYALQKINEVVIWDKVINSTETALLSMKNNFIKYPLLDQGKELRGTPVSLTLHWDVMPITGKLYMDTRGKHTVRMPDRYCSEMETKCRIEPPIDEVLDKVTAAA